MATYYVATNGDDSRTTTQAQNSTTPWKTFSKAASASAAGDTIRIKAGTYNELLVVTKSGQTWTGDDTANKANWPVIDGKFGPSNLKQIGGGYGYTLTNPLTLGNAVLPTWSNSKDAYGALVRVQSGVTGTTIAYMKVINSAGRAFSVAGTCDNTTIDNCIVDFTYSGAFAGNTDGPTIMQDHTISNCVVTRSSIKLFDPDRPSENTAGGEAVDTTIHPVFAENTQILNNTVAFVYGEGIAAARGSKDVLIEGNIVHNAYHWSIGVNCARDVIIRNNITWQDSNLPLIGVNSAGLIVGDENASLVKTKAYRGTNWYSERVAIYNNLSIGSRTAFSLRGTDDYRTYIDKLYVGYNTLIPGPKLPDATRDTFAINLTKAQQTLNNFSPHRSALFENNAVIRGQGVGIVKHDGVLTNLVFRHNAYSHAAGDIAGSGDITSTNVASRLTNVNAPRKVSGYAPDISNEAMAAVLTRLETEASAFKVANYHLVGGSESERSPLIGAGSVHTAINGITPAVGPNAGQYAKDYRGHLTGSPSRSDLDAGAGKYYDIGFHELTTTASGVTPSFTQTNPSTGDPITSGTVPVAVRFTDTSTTSGGTTIVERQWKFDVNGAELPTPSSGTTIDYTYKTPGTYTPVLVLRSSEDGNSKWYTKVGAPMTFTGDNTGGDGVYIDTVSVATGTSTGTLEFTFNLGDNVPKLVVFTMTAATSTSTVADGALLAHGFVSSTGGVSQYGVATFSKDNVAATSTGRYQTQGWCLVSISEGGTVTGSAYAAGNAFAANKVTLTIDDAFPASYLVTATAYGGNGIQAAVGTGTGPLSSVAQVTVPVGFQPSLFCLVTNNRTMGNAGTTAAFSIGYATSPTNQYYVRWSENEAENTALPEINAGAGIAYRFVNNTPITMRVQSMGPTGVVLAADETYNAGFGWYAIRTELNLDMRLLQVAVPTSGSNQDVTLGWQPGHMQSITTNLPMPVSPATWKINDTGSNASHIGLHVNRDAAGAIPAFERTNLPGIRHGDGAGTTNTTSRILNNAIGIRRSYSQGTADAINTELEAAASFLSTGYRLAWTTQLLSDRAWLVIAMQTGTATAPTGPIVSFQVVDAGGNTPVTGIEKATAYLTDTSDANGATITQWNIDWGDGVTQGVVTRPAALEHVYVVVGTYSVAVSATNSNGTTTVTAANVVIVSAEPGNQIIGPLRPGTITEDTTNEVVLDIDNPRRGFITHQLRLGALKIANNYPVFTVDSSRWQIAVVGNTLKVMDSAGRTGTLNITWDGSPPTGNGGTVKATIISGSDDAKQKFDGEIELSNATEVTVSGTAQWAALRFTNITIPAAATIQSATLKVYVYDTSFQSPDVDIYANKVANPTTLAATTNYISGLTKTTAKVTWTATNIGTGWKSPGDLKTVIQEIVNQAGWAAGNAMTLIFDGLSTNGIRWYSYEYQSYPPELEITWTA